MQWLVLRQCLVESQKWQVLFISLVCHFCSNDILTLLLFPLLFSSSSPLAVFVGDFAPSPRFQVFICSDLKFLYILSCINFKTQSNSVCCSSWILKGYQNLSFLFKIKPLLTRKVRRKKIIICRILFWCTTKFWELTVQKCRTDPCLTIIN